MTQINPVENYEPKVKQQNFLTHASKDFSLTRQLLSSAKLLTPFNEPPKRQSRVNLQCWSSPCNTSLGQHHACCLSCRWPGSHSLNISH